MERLSLTSLELLRANPRFLLKELLERGVAASVFDVERELFVLEHGGRKRWLLGVEHEALSWVTWELVNDKMLTKQLLLEAGLSAPLGRRFPFSALDAALVYGRSLGYPLVVKPFNAGRGENVHVGLTSMREVEGAAELICQRRADAYFLLEKQVEGEELRIFVTRSGRFAAVTRSPASVTGDGKSTIKELAKIETERRMNPRTNCLGPIEIDADAERWLVRHGLSGDSVPASGQRVQVRGHVEGSAAWVEDATDRIHPSLAEICHRALLCFPGALYLGIDVVSHAPDRAQDAGSYSILEVNNNPALGLHHAPAVGRGRNVAAEIADTLFPETKSTNLELLPCRAL
jgi:cyanophycin synthetase